MTEPLSIEDINNLQTENIRLKTSLLAIAGQKVSKKGHFCKNFICIDCRNEGLGCCKAEQCLRRCQQFALQAYEGTL